MSDVDSPPAGDAGQVGSAGQGLAGPMAKLGSGEKFAVLRAVITLGGWALFDVLIDDRAPCICSGGCVAAVCLRPPSGAKPEAVPYRTVLFVCAGLLGIPGVWDVVEEARNEVFEADFTAILGALI